MSNLDKIKIIILAAGHGKRMQAELPKALTLLQGKPFIKHLLESVTASGVCENPIIVIGQKGDQVRGALGENYTYAIQEKQLGTGHAVASAQNKVNADDKIILVFSADQPLISKETIERIISKHLEKKPTITMATIRVPDFEEWRSCLRHFGRIIRGTDGLVKEIVEYKDATTEEKLSKELNPAVYAFKADWLWQNIHNLKNENAQGEYYLTDLIKIAGAQNKKIETVPIANLIEGLQPNTKAELEILEKLVV